MARLQTRFGDTTTFFHALLLFVAVIISVVLQDYFNILNDTMHWNAFAACSFAVVFVTGFPIFKNFLHRKLNTYTKTLPTHKVLLWCGWKYLIMSWYRPWLQEFFCDNFEMQHHIILIEMSKLPTHFGDIVTFLYMALSFVTMIIGVAVLQAHLRDSNAQLFMGTLVACFFAVGIVIGFRSFVNFLHRKLNTSTETLLTHKILIGCGGAYLIASVPCIGVFWWDEEDSGKIWYILTVFPLFGAFFFAFFALEHQSLYRFDWILQFPRIFKAFFITTMIIFLSLVGCTYGNNCSLYKAIVTYLCHFVFLPLRWIGFTEFWLVMQGGIKWKLSEEELDAPCSSSVGERNYFLECGICLQTYNTTTKIPRILKECGHSICEFCSKHMKTKRNFKRVIVCPFCKIVTPIKARALEPLPKNYAVLGLLEEQMIQNSRL